mmetsp:Transcript_56468/g.137034  ORF Transcript_56468/g.137034 Transcript_56468/m.137034 type:complete len:232 (-) Transcript_56468:89-784(-)
MLCPLLWTASSNSCSASLMRFGGSVRIVSSNRPCIKSRVTEAGTDTSLGRPNFPDRSLLGPAVVEALAPLPSGLTFGFVFIFLLLLLFDGVSYFGFFAPFPGDDGEDTVVDVADDGRFRGIDVVLEVAGLSTAPEVVEVVVSLLTATLIDSELSGGRACCLSPTSSSVVSVFTGVAETESFVDLDPPGISSCWRRSCSVTETLLPPPSSCSSPSSSSPPPKRSSSSSSSFL